MADGASSSAAPAGGGGGGGGGESVVIDYGRRRTTCGYCRSTGPTSISHGLWANSLKADDYQALLDRGWRRSGSFLYKPEMERTCCPAYTIRLKASDFICSKEQDRVLKRMQRFLDGELDPQVGSPQCKINPTKRSLNEPMNSPTLKVSRVSAYEFRTATCPSVDKEDEFISCLSSKINEAIGTCFQGGMVGSDVELPKAIVKTVKPQVKKKVGEAAQEKKGGWVRYDVAKPLLDKSLYSVLSDFSSMAQDEIPQPHTCGSCDEPSAKNDHHETPIDEDDEDSGSDYDESDMMVDEETVHSESNGDTAEDCSDVDVANVIMDLSGSRVKYKELQSVVGPIQRKHLSELERQLSRYAKVVGKELSDRVVYSIS